MRYKVQNTVTGEETICKKVVGTDGFEYYAGNGELVNCICIDIIQGTVGHSIYYNKKEDHCMKVIATTNPSLGLPMVIDDNFELWVEYRDKRLSTMGNSQYWDIDGSKRSFLDGYQQAKETYSYTKEDLINFKQQAPLILEQLNGASDSELLDIWQEQRTIEILVK